MRMLKSTHINQKIKRNETKSARRKAQLCLINIKWCRTVIAVHHSFWWKQSFFDEKIKHERNIKWRHLCSPKVFDSKCFTSSSFIFHLAKANENRTHTRRVIHVLINLIFSTIYKQNWRVFSLVWLFTVTHSLFLRFWLVSDICSFIFLGNAYFFRSFWRVRFLRMHGTSINFGISSEIKEQPNIR